MLTDQQIEEFQDLYRKRYKKEISKKDALEQSIKLVMLLRRIDKPMTKERFEEIQIYRMKILPDIIQRVAHQEDDSETSQDRDR